VCSFPDRGCLAPGSPRRHHPFPGWIDVPAHLTGVIAMAITAALVSFATARQGIVV
jgi:hypothetical protein